MELGTAIGKMGTFSSCKRHEQKEDSMKEGEFEAGDKVRFQVGKDGLPRWDGKTESKPPFTSQIGTVTVTFGYFFHVSWECYKWSFWYDQQGEDGWPEIVSSDVPRNQLCECGGTKLGLPHSNWCPSHA
jgi:hypothetical protein